MRFAVVGMGWLAGAALIAFGVHGCAGGHNVYGWAVFGGLAMLTANTKDVDS
jgi:hypothetical protein